MFNNFKKFKFSFGAIFLLAVFILLMAPKLALAQYGNNVQYSYDGLTTVKTMSRPDGVSDPDNSIGLCTCKLSPNSNSPDIVYLYYPVGPIDLQVVRDNAVILWKKTLTFSKTTCVIETTGSPNKLDAGDSCKYYQPFCCCQADPKTGNRSGCSRQVYYDSQKLSPQCGADSKVYPEGSAGCGALNFQTDNTKNSDFQNQQLAAALESLKANAQQLNKVQFTSLPQVVGQIIRFFLYSIGTISFVLYIYAGFLWMTSAGNSEKTQQAKNILLWTTLGLLAVTGSYIVTKTVLSFVLSGTV